MCIVQMPGRDRRADLLLVLFRRSTALRKSLGMSMSASVIAFLPLRAPRPLGPHDHGRDALERVSRHRCANSLRPMRQRSTAASSDPGRQGRSRKYTLEYQSHGQSSANARSQWETRYETMAAATVDADRKRLLRQRGCRARRIFRSVGTPVRSWRAHHRAGAEFRPSEKLQAGSIADRIALAGGASLGRSFPGRQAGRPSQSGPP